MKDKKIGFISWIFLYGGLFTSSIRNYPAKSYQKGLFSDSLLLFFLRDLSGNNIEFIKEGVFNGLPKLSTL